MPNTVNVSDANSPHKGETVVYYFRGRNIYKDSCKGFGHNRYGAINQTRYPIDPTGAKMPLIVNRN